MSWGTESLAIAAASPSRKRAKAVANGTSAHRECGARTSRADHTIVVVDDNEDLRTIYSEILAIDGWHVRAFACAQDALISIESDPPDVVMTDINLEGLTGRGLARALRANPRTEDLLIVAASGSVLPTRQLLGAFDEFLIKPVDIATLSARLRSLIDANAS